MDTPGRSGPDAGQRLSLGPGSRRARRWLASFCNHSATWTSFMLVSWEERTSIWKASFLQRPFLGQVEAVVAGHPPEDTPVIP